MQNYYPRYWHKISGLRSHRYPFFGIGNNYVGLSGANQSYTYVEGDKIYGVTRPYGTKDIILTIYSPKRAKGFDIALDQAPSQIKSQFQKNGEEKIRQQVTEITPDQINREAVIIAHQAVLDAQVARNLKRQELTWYEKIFDAVLTKKKQIELTIAEWTGLKDEFKKKSEKFVEATDKLRSMNLPKDHPLWTVQNQIALQQREIASKVKETGQDGLGQIIVAAGVIILGISITYMILSFFESTDIFAQSVEAAKAMCNELPSEKRELCLEEVAKNVQAKMPDPGTGKGLFNWLFGPGTGKYLAMGGVGVLGLLVYLKFKGRITTATANPHFVRIGSGEIGINGALLRQDDNGEWNFDGPVAWGPKHVRESGRGPSWRGPISSDFAKDLIRRARKLEIDVKVFES